MLCDFQRRTERLVADLHSIEDMGLLEAVAFVLDICADSELCGGLLMEQDGPLQFSIHQVWIDGEIDEALMHKFGENLIQDAVDWFIDWISENGTVEWLGWRFRIDLQGSHRDPLQICVNNVVYCFHERRTTGVTLWDNQTLQTSTLIPIPSWRNI